MPDQSHRPPRAGSVDLAGVSMPRCGTRVQCKPQPGSSAPRRVSPTVSYVRATSGLGDGVGSEAQADAGTLRAQVASLRAENARLLRLLELTPVQARPPGPAQTAIFDGVPGAVCVQPHRQS